MGSSPSLGGEDLRDKMRPSKVVLTFGPGSIVDLPERESVMVMGADYWLSHRPIQEPRLARKLDVDHFGSPRNSWDESNNRPIGIPVRDFPFRRVCPECHRLWYITDLRYGIECPACHKDEEGHGPRTIPPRLVAACKNGHIQDFPWRWWCGCKCNYRDSVLYLHGEGEDTICSDLKVECKTCGKKKNLMGALDYHRITCLGKRPWLGDEEECDENLKGLMRGASNVFFPMIESSLSIPPFSNHTHVLLQNHIGPARENWRLGGIDGIRAYVRANIGLNRVMEREGLTEEDVIRAFEQIYGDTRPVRIKEEEWERLTHSVNYHPLNDFQTEELELGGSDLEPWFRSIKRVTKLREVIAIKGLTRVEPFDGDDDRMQPIRIEDVDTWNRLISDHPEITPRLPEVAQRDWLPGVEMYGEGIFFELNEDALHEWENNDDIQRRCALIGGQENAPPSREGIDAAIPRTLLIHSFAHQIIRQISFACGYSLASLRERIYSGEHDLSMCGVLIYTASPDSEGTLGGLVAQAKDVTTIRNHIYSMIESVRECSQDPLCGAHDPSSTGDAWGASCHSCSQLPETSCEGLQNKLLDRFVLSGNEDMEGYFTVQ